MSFTAKVVTTLQIDSDDVETVATRTFSGLTAVDTYKEVVNNAAVTLWDPTVAGVGIANFDLMVLSTDVEVQVEMTVNEGHADEELNSFTLAANTSMVLGSDDAYYNHSASDVWGGSADVIDKIRIKEENSVAATVVLRLFS